MEKSALNDSKLTQPKNSSTNREEDNMGDDSNAKKMTEGRRSFLAKALGVLAGTSLFGGAGKLVAQTVKRNTVSSTGPKQVADTTPYVGEILLFAGNFAPVGWAFCDGQILAISDYDVLFSILGTTYGGNGTTNFALPGSARQSADRIRTRRGIEQLRPGSNRRRRKPHSHHSRNAAAYSFGKCRYGRRHIRQPLQQCTGCKQ